MYMMRIALPLILGVATAASLGADLPVRQVVLYKHGVGYFERSGDLAPGESARLDFKAAEMNDVLKSLNMQMQDWQSIWVFDFPSEFDAGTTATDAAMKANMFWWHRQNQALGQDCRITANCWLPRNHKGSCETVS